MIGNQVSVRSNGKRMTAKERAQKLVDSGVDIYILRWKRRSFFPVKTFGFEEVVLKERFDHNLMASVFDKVPVRGKATAFEPEDGDDIPIAYVAATEHNKESLARNLNNAPYVIFSLVGFGGTKSSEIAVAELRAIAEKLPPVKEKRWIGRDINGKILRNDGAKPMIEKREKVPATPRECFEAAEKTVLEKNGLLLDLLKKKHGHNYKRIKDYKDSIGNEVERVYLELLEKYGMKDDRVAEVEDEIVEQ